jgi:hypothetical protein
MLGNLLISPCLKRRIKESDIRDHRKRRGQTPPCSLNVAPTKVEDRFTSRVDGYYSKEWIT